MAKAIIFDVSGVLTDDNLPEKLLRMSQERGLEFGRVLEAVDLINYTDAVVGRITAKEMHEASANALELGMGYDEFVSLYLSGYAVRPDMIDFLRRLGSERRLFVLSNQTPINSEFLHGVLDTFFEKIYFSNEVGLSKPDPRFFQKLLDETGLRADECIFIDDNMENIKAAWSLGFKVILFRGRERLLEDLKAFGIRIA